MRNRIAAAMLALCLLCTGAFADFTDVPNDAWYAEAVSWAQANGIMDGVSEGSFAPDGAVTRAMLGGRFGRCVFVSSAATERPAPGQTLYSAAKAAGEALFRGTGIELAGKGITTCAARLPWLPLGRGRIFLETHDTDAQRAMPAGKLVDTDAVVQALCWLISAEAAVINAAVIPLDGGLSSRKAGV